jgi:hypothetical protein
MSKEIHSWWGLARLNILLVVLLASFWLLASDAYAQRFLLVVNRVVDMNQPGGTCRGNVDITLVNAKQDPSDHRKFGVFCYLSRVAGKFAGDGESGGLATIDDGPGRGGVNWHFLGSSCQPGVTFNVLCVEMTP